MPLHGKRAVAIILLVAGCGSGDIAPDEVAAYLQDLPPWPQAAADADAPSGTARPMEEIVDNVVYACTTTPHSITHTPEKVVTLNPGADVLWPGVLLQGKSYLGGAGSFAELPIRQRAPLAISIDVLFSGNTRTVEAPDLASVTQAVGDIIQAAGKAGVKIQSSIDYAKTTSFSAEQTAVALGLSARYLSAQIKAKLTASRNASTTTVTASFIQRAFTVSAVAPQTPSDFFTPDFTADDLQRQIDLGRLGPDNLPVYLASVTYGRILLFTFTASASTTEITGTLNAMFNGVVAGGSVSLSARQKELLKTSEISVFTLGGDADFALAVIRSGNLADFFTADATVSTFVPISYTLRNVGDNSIARVSETTSYDLKECRATTAGQVPRDGLKIELQFNASERIPGNPGATPNSAPAASRNGIIEDGCRVADTADRFERAGRAADFFGSGGCDAAEPSLVYVEAPGYTKSFTLALWVTESLNDKWIIGPRGGPGLVCASAGAVGFEMVGRPLLTDGKPIGEGWRFLAVTAAFDGSGTDVVLYRDGLAVATTRVSGDLGVSPSAPTLIGNARGGPDAANPGRARDFQGKVDDVRVYDRALGAEEIVTLFNEAEST